MRCEQATVEISARLDGELDRRVQEDLDGHLASCEKCRAALDRAAAVRRLVRTQPAPEVPDVVAEVMKRVEAEREPSSMPLRRRPVAQEHRIRIRIAAFAAAVSALLFIGASLPFGTDPPQTASASALVHKAQERARTLDRFGATFAVVERGWHESVPVRRFEVSVDFHAPERFRLEVDDLTAYPQRGEWAPNDVSLIARPGGWSMREPASCPALAPRPECGLGGAPEERAFVNREPFDGTIALPTDIIVPIETFATHEGLEVVGYDEIGGRSAQHVVLSYRRAAPLISSLQAGGAWRPFHPSDTVDMWLETETLFPLGFRVTAGSSDDRDAWAQRAGLNDEPGHALLEVEAKSFARQPSTPTRFTPEQRGVVASGEFVPVSFGEIDPAVLPADRAGLAPYRAGRVESRTVATFADGMAWLKLSADPSKQQRPPLTAEEISLGSGEWGYYEPATELRGRRLHLFSTDQTVLLETNLPRAALLEVARSLPLDTRRVAAGSYRSGGITLRRLDVGAIPRGWATPTYLPPGYELRAGFSSTTGSTRSVTTVFRNSEIEYDGVGLRVTETHGQTVLPPTPERAIDITYDQLSVRWFPGRGEIDWIEDGTYTSILAPSFDLNTTLRVAKSLR
jgi:Putative zinc-finger